jgi:hypothetical protein
MHDNDPKNEAELIDFEILEKTPIAFCTLTDIISYLQIRYGDVIVAVPQETFVWGEEKACEMMIGEIQRVHASTDYTDTEDFE